VLAPGTVRRVVPLGGLTRVDVDTAGGPLSCLVPGPLADAPRGRPLLVGFARCDARPLAGGSSQEVPLTVPRREQSA
jgi:hypothetical protein